MSRVEVVFPEKAHFSTELTVRIGDINYGNHLGHDRMVTMIHEARILFFRSIGYSEIDVEGVGTVIADLAVSYRNETFYGDLLRFDIAVQNISRKSCQFYYRIVRLQQDSDEKGDLIALAKTSVVFFDYAERRSAVIPAGFIAQLDKLST